MEHGSLLNANKKVNHYYYFIFFAHIFSAWYLYGRLKRSLFNPTARKTIQGQDNTLRCC